MLNFFKKLTGQTSYDNIGSGTDNKSSGQQRQPRSYGGGYGSMGTSTPQNNGTPSTPTETGPTHSGPGNRK